MVIGTLVPRRIFEEVGGFDDWPIYEDWELWIRCVEAGCALKTAVEAVYIVHERDGSRNNQSPEFQREIYDKIRAYHMQ
jgi:GT2 family glycosyltransferase